MSNIQTEKVPEQQTVLRRFQKPAGHL